MSFSFQLPANHVSKSLQYPLLLSAMTSDSSTFHLILCKQMFHQTDPHHPGILVTCFSFAYLSKELWWRWWYNQNLILTSGDHNLMIVCFCFEMQVKKRRILLSNSFLLADCLKENVIKLHDGIEQEKRATPKKSLEKGRNWCTFFSTEQ